MHRQGMFPMTQFGIVIFKLTLLISSTLCTHQSLTIHMHYSITIKHVYIFSADAFTAYYVTQIY